MSIPSDRKYASTHEWIKADGDVMLVGITGPAQEQLGDLVKKDLAKWRSVVQRAKLQAD